MRRRKSGLNFNRTHEKKKINFTIVREVLTWAIEIAIVLALAFVLVYFVGLRTSVIGRSMEPTLRGTDEILVDRFVYKLIDPRRDDIIVFLPNGNEKSHYYVKRVIGVPGDTVRIENGTVYVNGEEYHGELEYEAVTDPGIAEDEITLGADEFFVLGDNLDSSEDSRYANIGNISKDYIIGKAWAIVKPKTRMGII
ncbi:MAG: signal peptidase I [Lachnospiraceae bacterium]|nr:signal peptidase I [Lachnospiraceae bacterium]